MEIGQFLSAQRAFEKRQLFLGHSVGACPTVHCMSDSLILKNIVYFQEDQVNYCWKQWATNELTKKGKIDFDEFKEMFDIQDDDNKETKKLFNLLDFDDDDKVEFPELMLYIYSTDGNMSR